MGVGSGMLATSSRCCTRRPKGPAAVSLGNDGRTERILMSGSRVRGAVWATGATGVGPLGCLACNTELPCDLIIWGNTTGLKDSACFPIMPDLPN